MQFGNLTEALLRKNRSNNPLKGATGNNELVPEVIAVPIIGGNEDYLKWINSEVSG